MHLLEERQGSPKHARPVRCPQCRKFVPVLVFDSPAVGMVCVSCHRSFMELRTEAALVPKHRRTEIVTTMVPLRCAHCQELALVFVDAHPSGRLCQHCHERATSVSEEPKGMHIPHTAISEDHTSTTRRSP
jgi:ribosomal protein S27E